jgi:hypothetical protein
MTAAQPELLAERLRERETGQAVRLPEWEPGLAVLALPPEREQEQAVLALPPERESLPEREVLAALALLLAARSLPVSIEKMARAKQPGQARRRPGRELLARLAA